MYKKSDLHQAWAITFIDLYYTNLNSYAVWTYKYGQIQLAEDRKFYQSCLNRQTMMFKYLCILLCALSFWAGTATHSIEDSSSDRIEYEEVKLPERVTFGEVSLSEGNELAERYCSFFELKPN